MSEEFESTVNAEPEQTVDAQIEVQPQENVSEEVVEPQRQVQDPQTNAYFADMRRQNEKLQKDYQVSKEWGHLGIHTEEDYQKALAEQEAQRIGVDPQFYEKFNNVVSELDSIKREKTLLQQETQLKNDPTTGRFFNEWESEIKQLSGSTGANYEQTFNFLLMKRLPQIIGNTESQTEQTTIKKLTQNANTSPGALGQGGDIQTSSVKDMSNTDFSKIVDEVLRGERKQL